MHVGLRHLNTFGSKVHTSGSKLALDQQHHCTGNININIHIYMYIYISYT
jgi:hypothetical protein